MTYDWDNTEKALDAFGQKVVKDARSNLAKKGRNTRNMSLSKSLKSKVVEGENSVALQISMTDYGKFVDEGVRGVGGSSYTWKSSVPKRLRARNSRFKFRTKGASRGMQDAFKDWIRAKPLQPRDPITGRFMTRETSAFLMARSAKRYGLKASNFMKDAINKNLPNLNRDLGLSVSKDIAEFIEEDINKTFN